MKVLISMITFSLFSSAFAANYTASTAWEVLEKDPSIKIDAGTVFMGYSIDYTFVCVDGKNLRTKKPVAQYDVIYIGQNQEKRIDKGSKYLSTPINYTRTTWDCQYTRNGEDKVCQDKVISGSYALTVNAKISRVIRSGENDQEKFLFNKQLNVPNCQ